MAARLFIRTVEWLLVALLGLMVVLVFGNVVLRYGFNTGWVFSEEVSRFLFMWLTLLGALLALHHGGHLGMNSVVAALPVAGQRVLRFIGDLAMLGCCTLLAWGTWLQVVLAMDERAPVTGIPMGIVFSALLVCSLGMALMLAHGLWRQATGRMPACELVRGGDAVE
ncbi:2,3-diketo-L-gulonate TRAP transporter small permease protein yiaM [Delftia tsuruhatensis]|uniref:TRAP transporter small permease n=1 Tax=Delftia tsuruhatensis TaxID=180282 RepID=UPI001E7BC49A|nr:TRAP transporter small permease [Delftia tsuruhatensis]CAB5660532.1 2,3-diketo-L-gulonate TRAP transporter small permease protein yiaM [Delftia tsuruhatensis]CAC9679895.1 2,3-diketo-L-gulonate TRAP transporter small permease protein yiaM [Delftia tsuruhatensis]